MSHDLNEPIMKYSTRVYPLYQFELGYPHLPFSAQVHWILSVIHVATRDKQSQIGHDQYSRKTSEKAWVRGEMRGGVDRAGRDGEGKTFSENRQERYKVQQFLL